MLDRPAARSLSECLVLQLDAIPAGTPALAEAKAIAREHLERLARRETAEIQRRLGCDAPTLQAACALVRGRPAPGNHYGSTRGDYVVPDVIVRQARRVDRDDQPGRAARGCMNAMRRCSRSRAANATRRSASSCRKRAG